MSIFVQQFESAPEEGPAMFDGEGILMQAQTPSTEDSAVNLAGNDETIIDSRSDSSTGLDPVKEMILAGITSRVWKLFGEIGLDKEKLQSPLREFITEMAEDVEDRVYVLLRDNGELDRMIHIEHIDYSYIKYVIREEFKKVMAEYGIVLKEKSEQQVA